MLYNAYTIKIEYLTSWHGCCGIISTLSLNKKTVPPQTKTMKFWSLEQGTLSFVLELLVAVNKAAKLKSWSFLLKHVKTKIGFWRRGIDRESSNLAVSEKQVADRFYSATKKYSISAGYDRQHQRWNRYMMCSLRGLPRSIKRTCSECMWRYRKRGEDICDDTANTV